VKPGLSDGEVLVIGAAEVEAALKGREDDVLNAVQKAYETHSRGASSLPHSSFLSFPDNDRDRIICLPAFLGEDYQLAGVKWIASVPDNVQRGLERASAVIVLNERATGRPIAVIEGSIISKQRTAASAALASRVLAREMPECIGLVGCGPINAAIAEFLQVEWPGVRNLLAYDLDVGRAAEFASHLMDRREACEVQVASSLDEVLARCPLVSFATTTITPHVESLENCPVDAVILHISLRDLGPDVVLAACNVVDDLDHVNRANTSIHLAARQVGHTEFVHGTLGELLLGRAQLPEKDDRPMVFSPFGLGVLDLAVADLVHQSLLSSGGGMRVPSFLP
jgi:ornithine cyclodeaminase